MDKNIAIFHDAAGIRAQVKGDVLKVRRAISTELLKDSNYYARQDSGAMIKSSQIASNLDEGELMWDTPYAKSAYYTGVPSTDTNPHASLLWAEKAATEGKEKYERIAKKVIGGEGR